MARFAAFADSGRMAIQKRIMLIGTGRGGKSMLAANLASEFARRGKRSALHDIAPRQQNLLRWEDQARRNEFETPPVSVGRGSSLPEVAQAADVVIVDSPAYNGLDEWFERVGETLEHCDGALLLWNPDPSGAWSIGDLVTNVAQMAPETSVCVVTNRYRKSKQSAASLNAVPMRYRPAVLDTVIHERTAFSESFGCGSEIMGYPHRDSDAKAEFQSVFAEVCERFEIKVGRPIKAGRRQASTTKKNRKAA